MSAASRHSFVLGLNYWPRRKAMYWWKSFDPGEVDEEFAQIAEWGIHVVRFCLMWEDFQPEPERVEQGQLQNLVRVMDTAEKHGLHAMPTLLVGNMSGVMWFPPWAFADQPQQNRMLQISQGRYVHRQLRSPFDDPGMLRAEALLARSATGAVAGHPALHSWDLANEIDQAYLPAGPDSGWLWAWSTSQAIRDVDQQVPVTYGAHALSLTTHGLTVPAIAPSLDFLSMHGYPIYSDIARGPLDTELVPFMTALTAHLGHEPALMQEFGLCTASPGEASQTVEDDFLGEIKPQFLAGEEDAAQYYRAVLDRLWETGSLGAMAWDYADYAEELWDKPPLDRAKRERTFGIFRADGSAKPAAEVLRRFSEELRSGAIERRLGPHGGKAVRLTIAPQLYYQEPATSYRQAYAEYLGRLRATRPETASKAQDGERW
jgi:endo-1,4-beta-mannosidase